MSRYLKRIVQLCIYVMIPITCANAQVLLRLNEENGLQTWHFIDGDIEIELVQRLPDQSRALFYEA